MANTEPVTGIPSWTVGDRLAKALNHSDVSVQEMAVYLGISRNTVGNYIAGRTVARRAIVLAWALRTGVPAEWLLTGEVPEPGPDAPEGLDSSATGWYGNVTPLRRSAPAIERVEPAKKVA